MVALLGSFDALSSDFDRQRVCNFHDGFDDRKCFLIFAQGIDEGFVDLQLLKLKLFEVVEGGVTAAKIIKDDTHTHIQQAFERIDCFTGFVKHHRFGNFQLKPARLQPAFTECVGDLFDEVADSKLSCGNIYRLRDM